MNEYSEKVKNFVLKMYDYFPEKFDDCFNVNSSRKVNFSKIKPEYKDFVKKILEEKLSKINDMKLDLVTNNNSWKFDYDRDNPEKIDPTGKGKYNCNMFVNTGEACPSMAFSSTLKEFERSLKIAKKHKLKIVPYHIGLCYKFTLKNGTQIDTSSWNWRNDYLSKMEETYGGNILYSKSIENKNREYTTYEELCPIDEVNVYLSGIEVEELEKIIDSCKSSIRESIKRKYFENRKAIAK